MTTKTNKMNIGSKRAILIISNGKRESRREKSWTSKDKQKTLNTRKETKKEKNKKSLSNIWEKLNSLINLLVTSAI